MGGGKLIGYTRVSTEGQSTNGHSLDGQQARLREAAERAGYELLDVVVEVKSGAKQRDGLDEAVRRIEAGEAEGLVFAKLDRLGRSQIHLAQVVKWARDRGVTLLSADEGMKVERGALRDEALPFMIALAQVERERISRRTKEGLDAARINGAKLGRPVSVPDEVTQYAVRLRREGLTIQQIADRLSAEGFRNRNGNPYGVSSIYGQITRVAPDANPEGGHRGNARAVAVA